jgi:hypothetical protein
VKNGNPRVNSFHSRSSSSATRTRHGGTKRRSIAEERQTTRRSIREGQAQPVEALMTSARRSLSGLPSRITCDKATAESCTIVLSPLCQHRKVDLPRRQALSDANTGFFAGDDDDLLARPKCRTDKLADLVQEVAVVGMNWTACRLPATVESEVRDGTNSRPARAWSIALIRSSGCAISARSRARRR